MEKAFKHELEIAVTLLRSLVERIAKETWKTRNPAVTRSIVQFMEVGVSGVTIGPNVARHVDWECGHVSGSVTILSLNMVADRVMNKNGNRLNTAENGIAIQNIRLPAPEKAGNQAVARHLARGVNPVTGRSTVAKGPGAMMKTCERNNESGTSLGKSLRTILVFMQLTSLILKVCKICIR